MKHSIAKLKECSGKDCPLCKLGIPRKKIAIQLDLITRETYYIEIPEIIVEKMEKKGERK